MGRWRAGAVGVVTAGIALLATAGPVGAHATLEASVPADQARLETHPGEVILRFDEPVSVGPSGLRVFAADGSRVDEGTTEATDASVRVALEDIDAGAYVATYRVVSADGHPVRGALTFTVGDARPADEQLVADLLGDDRHPRWEVAGFVARVLAYGGTLLAAGLALFLVTAHDGGPERPSLRRWSRLAAAAGAVGVVGMVPVQAVITGSQGLSSLRDGLGPATAFVLAGLAAVVALGTGGRRRPVVALGATGLATSGFALFGHTVTAEPRWLATAADVAHLLAAAVWLGGLVGVAAVLRRRQDHTGTAVALRFSGVAAAALIGVAVAGGAQTWTQVTDLDALTGTTYGRLLLAKGAAVAVVAAIGGWNRYRLLPLVVHAPARPTLLLRRAVAAEVVVLVGVVAASAVLVDIGPPAADAAAAARASTVAFGEGTADLDLSPGRAGTNQLHLTLRDPFGRPVTDLESVELRLSLPAADIGPLVRTPHPAGPGRWSLHHVDLTVPGTWTVDVAARRDRFDQETARLSVTINP